jgi:ABC-type proline/glycine betaine transport system ATPase subunit
MSADIHFKDVSVLFITHDVDEAVYLANCVAVMGARPGRLLEVIDVDLPHPRTEEIRLAPGLCRHPQPHLTRRLSPTEPSQSSLTVQQEKNHEATPSASAISGRVRCGCLPRIGPRSRRSIPWATRTGCWGRRA